MSFDDVPEPGRKDQRVAFLVSGTGGVLSAAGTVLLVYGAIKDVEQFFWLGCGLLFVGVFFMYGGLFTKLVSRFL